MELAHTLQWMFTISTWHRVGKGFWVSSHWWGLQGMDHRVVEVLWTAWDEQPEGPQRKDNLVQGDHSIQRPFCHGRPVY